MIILLAFIGIFMLGAAGLALAGLTLYDLREIHAARAYARHPHARIYRSRPTVAAHIYGKSSPEYIGQLKRSYRKLHIAGTPEETTPYELVLEATVPALPTKHAINQALVVLAGSPQSQAALLPSQPAKPSSLFELLRNYQLIANTTFQKSRVGLGVRPHGVLALRRQASTSPWEQTYELLGAAACIVVATTVMLSAYFVVIFHQTDLFVALLAGFGVFMIASIWGHEGLRPKEKVYYSALLPVCVGYFAGRLARRVLKMLTDMVKAIFGRRVGLFVRIKDILRVIKFFDFFHIP